MLEAKRRKMQQITMNEMAKDQVALCKDIGCMLYIKVLALTLVQNPFFKNLE